MTKSSKPVTTPVADAAPESADITSSTAPAPDAPVAPSADHANPSAKEATEVKARVLIDGVFGKVNDVVEVPEDVAAASGDLDSHPDAVAYAESLKG